MIGFTRWSIIAFTRRRRRGPARKNAERRLSARGRNVQRGQRFRLLVLRGGGKLSTFRGAGIRAKEPPGTDGRGAMDSGHPPVDRRTGIAGLSDCSRWTLPGVVTVGVDFGGVAGLAVQDLIAGRSAVAASLASCGQAEQCVAERAAFVAVASDAPDRPIADSEALRKLMDRDAGVAEVSDALDGGAQIALAEGEHGVHADDLGALAVGELACGVAHSASISARTVERWSARSRAVMSSSTSSVSAAVISSAIS